MSSSGSEVSSKKVVKTNCPYCGVGCGIDIQVGSKGFKSIGNKKHPANFGKLCVKGSATDETLDFEGRMLYPQVNGRTVAWHQAIEKVATQFQQTITEHGPDSVAFYVSGQLLTEDYYIANKLIKGFMGTANIDTNSRLCMASAVVGYKRAFGSDTVPCSYEDLETADVITLVGSNAAWAHPILYQRMAAAKKARPDMKIIVVDPRKTATCDIADLHLAIKPGTDANLFNGLLVALDKLGKVNHDFVTNQTEGMEAALAEATKQQGSLDLVAKQCDVNLTDLVAWVNWCASKEKMVTFYSQGVNQSTSGVDKSNAIINCHLATGRLGYEGAGPFSITGQPNAMGGREVGGLANQLAAHMDYKDADSIDRVSRFWQAENMAQDVGLKAVDMFNAVGEGKIKAIWIMNTNPLVSMPEANRVKEALLSDDVFVVVSDCMQKTDTTEVADVLLPALAWGETSGMVTNSERRMSLQRQFMAGPEHAKPDWWIMMQVAHQLGWKDQFDYESSADIFREHAQLSGFENHENEGGRLRDFDISFFSDMSKEDYENFEPVQWPVTHLASSGTKRMFADKKFFTPNRKAQFIPITPKPPASQRSQKFPFYLNTGRVRDQWHTMTRTAKTDRLMKHKAEPYLNIHPQDAQTYRLEEGSLARVSNDLGVYIARVELSEAQRRNEIFAPMHWTGQYASHARVDVLVKANVDALSGQPESKHSVVKVEKYPAKWYGFLLSRTALSESVLESLSKTKMGQTGEAGKDNKTEQDVYWVKIKGKKFYRYEFASTQPIDFESVLIQEENQSLLSYSDDALGQARYAVMQEDVLQAVAFFSTEHNLPARQWLGSLFAMTEIDATTRRSLLAGQLSGAKDEGKIICACFSVGVNTILETLTTHKVSTTEEIGKLLKAGTNCGSCVPELQVILDENQAKQLVS